MPVRNLHTISRTVITVYSECCVWQTVQVSTDYVSTTRTLWKDWDQEWLVRLCRQAVQPRQAMPRLLVRVWSATRNYTGWAKLFEKVQCVWRLTRMTDPRGTFWRSNSCIWLVGSSNTASTCRMPSSQCRIIELKCPQDRSKYHIEVDVL